MHSVLTLDRPCILKTLYLRWCDIDIVVFIIKLPHLAYSVDNRQHSTSASTSAVLTIGTIGHQNNRLYVQSVKLQQDQHGTVTIGTQNLDYTDPHQHLYKTMTDLWSTVCGKENHVIKLLPYQITVLSPIWEQISELGFSNFFQLARLIYMPQYYN